MSTDSRPLDRILDVLIYAPVGLALEARELIPRLAERGRGQVALLRLAQQVAARHAGPAEAGEQIRTQLLGAVDAIGGLLGIDLCGHAPGSAPTKDGPSSQEPREAPQGCSGSAPDEAAEQPGGEPLEGYDTMTAREIIARLPGLDADELHRVLLHERRNRARTTVLSSIAALRN